MGLDTSHDCWHGPYFAFMRWRRSIAKAVGIDDIMLMQGYADFGGKPWDANDPIVILLNHSDCDGEISWKDAAPLADRLEELLPKLEGSHARGDEYSDRGRAEKFIKGLRRAASAKESVDFH